MVILDNDKKGVLNLSARIILLNQRTQKLLSIITTKKFFLSSI